MIVHISHLQVVATSNNRCTDETVVVRSVVNPWLFGTDPDPPITNGFGSESCKFYHAPSS